MGCYNPQIQKLSLQPITDSLVPIMFTTGTADIIIRASDVKEAYKKTSGVPKVFANMQGSRHSEPCDANTDRFMEYSIAMMDCHLRDDAAQCAHVYGSDASSLCGGKFEMAECLHENELVMGLKATVV